jgi:hypothetical protein
VRREKSGGWKEFNVKLLFTRRKKLSIGISWRKHLSADYSEYFRVSVGLRGALVMRRGEKGGVMRLAKSFGNTESSTHLEVHSPR